MRISGKPKAWTCPISRSPTIRTPLIAQVSAANPHTIVVLETGTAVTMPRLDKVAGVVEVWFAGSAGHKALANITYRRSQSIRQAGHHLPEERAGPSP
ncbi:MAG: glycoside hydrolase family 3 C-terminal domain-containing protein, partial [Terracidiphilus sp.]